MSQLPEIKGMWCDSASSTTCLGTSPPPSFSNYCSQKWAPHIQSIEHFSTVASFATCLSVHWFCSLHWFGIGLQSSCTEDHLRNINSPSALWACVRFLFVLSVIQKLPSRCVWKEYHSRFLSINRHLGLNCLELAFYLRSRNNHPDGHNQRWIMASNTRNETIWEGECNLLILTVHLKSKETNDETIELIERERIHCIPEQMRVFLYPFG